MIAWIGSDEHWAILAVAFLAELAVLAHRYANPHGHHRESHRKLRATHPESPAADPTALPNNAAAAGTQTSTLQPAGGGLDVDQGLRCEPALPFGKRGESGDESHSPTSGTVTRSPDVGPKPQVAAADASDSPASIDNNRSGLGQPPVGDGVPKTLPSPTGSKTRQPDAAEGPKGAPAAATSLPVQGSAVAAAIDLLVGGAWS
jgi:hypothetical protein